jgi:hypothetical protein
VNGLEIRQKPSEFCERDAIEDIAKVRDVLLMGGGMHNSIPPKRKQKKGGSAD